MVIINYSSPNVENSHFFFFNDTATTEIYTLSLHDALPIFTGRRRDPAEGSCAEIRIRESPVETVEEVEDRKSTRLNSSHANISYAVFCLKKTNISDRHIMSLSTKSISSSCRTLTIQHHQFTVLTVSRRLTLP